jgi:hypothetical protein
MGDFKIFTEIAIMPVRRFSDVASDKAVRLARVFLKNNDDFKVVTQGGDRACIKRFSDYPKTLFPLRPTLAVYS